MKHDLRTLRTQVARAEAMNLNVCGVLVGENAAALLVQEVSFMQRLNANRCPVLVTGLMGHPITYARDPNALALIVEFPEPTHGL